MFFIITAKSLRILLNVRNIEAGLSLFYFLVAKAVEWLLSDLNVYPVVKMKVKIPSQKILGPMHG